VQLAPERLDVRGVADQLRRVLGLVRGVDQRLDLAHAELLLETAGERLTQRGRVALQPGQVVFRIRAVVHEARGLEVQHGDDGVAHDVQDRRAEDRVVEAHERRRLAVRVRLEQGVLDQPRLPAGDDGSNHGRADTRHRLAPLAGLDLGVVQPEGAGAPQPDVLTVIG